MLSTMVFNWISKDVLPDVFVDGVVKGNGSCGSCTTGGSTKYFVCSLRIEFIIFDSTVRDSFFQLLHGLTSSC